MYFEAILKFTLFPCRRANTWNAKGWEFFKEWIIHIIAELWY